MTPPLERAGAADNGWVFYVDHVGPMQWRGEIRACGTSPEPIHTGPRPFKWWAKRVAHRHVRTVARKRAAVA